MATSPQSPEVTPPLSRYRRKRDFEKTPEPSGAGSARRKAGRGRPPLSFVIQKHWASRLHYDFRLELDGVLLSWAVPKGPCYDPREKRMAVHVEDHPLDYAGFEGVIPPKQYGAGTVIVWDRGTWEPVGDAQDGMASGKLVFRLHGEKLAGLWELVRIAKPDDKQDQWMLFKKRDEWAAPLSEFDVIRALPDSVVDKPLGLIEEREPKRAGSPSGHSASGNIDLALAVAAPLPAKLEPQLATLTGAPPAAGGWVIETKFDGYRVMARFDAGKVRFFTRNGHDWTSKFKGLTAPIQALGLESAWLDGEMVVLKDGLPDFNALQNAIAGRHSDDIVYFVFDLPYYNGRDLRNVPLASRRALLQDLMGDAPEHLRFSESFDAAPAVAFEAACQLGLEGLLLKRTDAPYVSARSPTWLKLKCKLRQEFVICGYTERSAASREVGGMLIGYHQQGKLRYAGSVGTGWDAKTGRELLTLLSKLETDIPPIDPATVKPGRWSKRVAGDEHWVKPTQVAEVEFSEWTPNGHVRHPSFKGLRADKPARDITRESSTEPPGPATRASAVKITNADRVIDTSTGTTKGDLVRYYESVADWMLPHLQDRPVSLLRAPNGIQHELFFQKHPETKLPGLTEHDPALWPGHGALVTVDTADALVAAAQMNTVEFHTWNSQVANLFLPDRVIFDLDPGEGVKWEQVLDAAVLVQTLLTELELRAWLKTSGGKGLHVQVPLAPNLDYDIVKDFSRVFVHHLARTLPRQFSAKSGASNRVGKVYVDYLRNGRAQTTAAAFTARARPGMGVSMPVSWEKLRSLKSGSQWTVATAREYLSFEQVDPWADYWTCQQDLRRSMELLGYTAPKKTARARR